MNSNDTNELQDDIDFSHQDDAGSTGMLPKKNDSSSNVEDDDFGDIDFDDI